MDPAKSGRFIARRRKEQNLTQEQLAEKLGLSNKTISKWECGKCMPDYRSVKTLCDVLEISVAELMDGDEHDESISVYDDDQLIDILTRIQSLEKQNELFAGFMIVLLGMILNLLAALTGGSDMQNFLSGIMTGLGTAVALAGIVLCVKTLAKS